MVTFTSVTWSFSSDRQVRCTHALVHAFKVRLAEAEEIMDYIMFALIEILMSIINLLKKEHLIGLQGRISERGLQLERKGWGGGDNRIYPVFFCLLSCAAPRGALEIGQ